MTYYSFFISHLSLVVIFLYLHIIVNIKRNIKILLPSFQCQSVRSISTIIPLCTNRRCWLAIVLHSATYCFEYSCSFLLFGSSIPPSTLRPWTHFSLSLSHTFSCLPFAYFVILGIYSRPPIEILIRALFISYTFI